MAIGAQLFSVARWRLWRSGQGCKLLLNCNYEPRHCQRCIPWLGLPDRCSPPVQIASRPFLAPSRPLCTRQCTCTAFMQPAAEQEYQRGQAWLCFVSRLSEFLMPEQLHQHGYDADPLAGDEVDALDPDLQFSDDEAVSHALCHADS